MPIIVGRALIINTIHSAISCSLYLWKHNSPALFTHTLHNPCTAYFFSGYFRYLRALLNARVPSSLEASATPPTPLAAAIRDLVMTPLQLSSQNSTEEEAVFTANDRYFTQPDCIYMIIDT